MVTLSVFDNAVIFRSRSTHHTSNDRTVWRTTLFPIIMLDVYGIRASKEHSIAHCIVWQVNDISPTDDGRKRIIIKRDLGFIVDVYGISSSLDVVHLSIIKS